MPIIYLLVFVLGACSKVVPTETPKPEPQEPVREKEINEKVASPSTEGIKRLLLRKNAHIVTEEKELVIDVDELTSEGALIESFLPSQRGEKVGRGGGKIVLRAKKAHGTLNLRSSGENGGPGSLGERGKNGGVGSKGRPGQVRVGGLINLPELLLCRPDMRSFLTCEVAPTHGGDGQPGENGRNGTSGFTGGDTSAITIDIVDATDFKLNFTSEPGKGGPGGPGGEGGAGGAGGPPAEFEYACACPPVRSGHPGPGGLTGQSGPLGLDGRVAPYCIRLGEEKTGACD